MVASVPALSSRPYAFARSPLFGTAPTTRGLVERRFVPLLVTLNLLTLASGGLGCVSGVIVTAQYYERAVPPLAPSVPFLGVGESLNNVAFALVFVVVAAFAMSLGVWKIAREGGPARAD